MRPVPVPEDETVVLVSEQQSYVLMGAIYGRLVPLLDGKVNATEISRRLADDFSRFEVTEALVNLNRQGLLALGRADHSATSQGRFWDSVTDTATPSVTATVAIHACDGNAAHALASALRHINVHVNKQDATLTVVLTDSYLDPTIQDQCRRATVPLLLVKPRGREGWVGPLIVPDASVCWECLAHRLRHNRQAQQLLANDTGVPLSPQSILTSTLTVVNYAATQVAR